MFTLILVLILGTVLLGYLMVQPSSVKNAKQWNPEVDPDVLLEHVKQLSENLPERSHNPEHLNQSAAYISKQFQAFSKDVSYQTFAIGQVEFNNVVAKFGPKDSGPIYIVGAHYDTFAGLPGADDNASGVAGLIELARLFSLNQPKARIHLVAFALEEPPYFRTGDMGSFRHAEAYAQNSQNIALMISLEMIGYFNEKLGQNYPIPIMKSYYPNKANFIAVVGRFENFSLTKRFKENMRQATPLPVYSINAPSLIPGIDFSDHRNYWSFGYPAIMITDTAFYRNQNYHTEGDRWKTLDYEKMAMVVQGGYYALLSEIEKKH